MHGELVGKSSPRQMFRSTMAGRGVHDVSLLLAFLVCTTVQGALGFCPNTICQGRDVRVRAKPTGLTQWLASKRYGTNDASTRLDMMPPTLLTFDLDDTLFPIQEVVADANAAQIKAMQELGCKDLTSPDFLDRTRAIRKTLDSPITYSELRERVIRSFLEESCDMTATNTSSKLEEATKDCFSIWLNERQTAAEKHLFPDVVSSLRDLKTKYPDLCIAAITNGRGNPLDMENTLAPFFDFCVSGEDANVFPHRKPDKKIYEISLARYHQDYARDSKKDSSFVWFHVGDCLANDVGASADCGAYAIWVSKDGGENKDQSSWSTASKEEVERRKKLAQAAREKASGKISGIGELRVVIEGVLKSLTTMSDL